MRKKYDVKNIAKFCEFYNDFFYKFSFLQTAVLEWKNKFEFSTFVYTKFMCGCG